MKRLGKVKPFALLITVVLALDGEHVWAAGNGGIYYYDGSAWNEVDAPRESWTGISAHGPGQVWAADIGGGAYLFDGSTWKLMYQADESFKRDLSVSAAGGDVWLAECCGIYHGSKR